MAFRFYIKHVTLAISDEQKLDYTSEKTQIGYRGYRGCMQILYKYFL